MLPALGDALGRALTTPEMRRLYDLCDGSRTSRELAAAASVSVGTVSNWTRRWREAGIVYDDDSGRLRHLIPLSTVGLGIDG